MGAPENVGHLQQLGGTRLVTLQDGVERGVRVVEFRTAAGLDFGVLVDRAMDIAWCRYNGRSISWLSPVGLIGPWYREPEGLGFLRTFQGGLLVTCGLDHVLGPAEDPRDTYGYPGRTSARYGLHGRVSNTPALLRRYGEVRRGEDWELEAVGEVVQAGALAENLVLTRRLSTSLRGRSIVWDDEVENRGHQSAPHMLLYHVNLGAPLLDPSCELAAPIQEVVSRTPSATGGPDEHLRFTNPTPDFVEQVFEHRMEAGADGRVRVALLNRADPASPWGVVLDYDATTLPHFLQWRHFASGTYALGLEPSTTGLIGRALTRAQGELTMLEPGERLAYRTELSILDGAEECDQALRSIAHLPADEP